MTFAGKMFVKISQKRRADGARTRCAIVDSGLPGIMGARQAFDGCLQSPPTPTPEPPVPPAVCYKRTAGLGPASITEPFDADGRKMNSWYAKLPDWQIGVICWW